MKVRGLIAIVALIGCTDPTGANIVERDNGLGYTAVPIIPPGTSLFRLEVTVSNRSSRRVTMNFPDDCRVKVRLYNLRQQRVYDETGPCQSVSVGTLSIGPGNYTTLSTGNRILRVVFGDSLPAGTYRARAAIGMEGVWFEVPAGSLVYTPSEEH